MKYPYFRDANGCINADIVEDIIKEHKHEKYFKEYPCQCIDKYVGIIEKEFMLPQKPLQLALFDV